MTFRLAQTGIRNTNRLEAKFAAPCLDAQGEPIHFQQGITILHGSNHSPIALPNEEATVAFAMRLAHAIHPGLVIYLRGDLGAGKTTLVRALLLALGYTGRVKSPTYTLVESYEVRGLHLRHFDLYRFRDADEWEEAGFRDEFDAHNICLVEWPERAAGLLPDADLSLTFEILQDGREIFLHAYTEAGEKCLNAL
ncbi:hypothetical protein TK5_25200 [Sideroxyarcus sp. TK5]